MIAKVSIRWWSTIHGGSHGGPFFLCREQRLMFCFSLLNKKKQHLTFISVSLIKSEVQDFYAVLLVVRLRLGFPVHVDCPFCWVSTLFLLVSLSSLTLTLAITIFHKLSPSYPQSWKLQILFMSYLLVKVLCYVFLVFPMAVLRISAIWSLSQLMYLTITFRPTILDTQYASRDIQEALPFTGKDVFFIALIL